MLSIDQIKSSIDLREYISRTVPLKRQNRLWVALCPFHKEKSPSFTVYDDGRYHCFGCGEHGDVIDFVEKTQRVTRVRACELLESEFGLNGHAKPQPPSVAFRDTVPKSAPPSFDRYDHVYTYYTADGSPYRYILRKDATASSRKIFVPCTHGILDGKEGWHQKHAVAPRSLYNLHLLAQYPQKPVLLCEGEKAACAAQELFPAYVVTTWSGGAISIKQNDWSVLAGRDVTIWPDNDEPGANAAKELSAILEPFAKSISLVDPSSLPPKGDAADLPTTTPTDWVERHIAQPQTVQTRAADALPLLWFDDIAPVLDAKDFVQGTLVEGSSVVIYGKSNAGKTFWATDMALHIAAGKEWSGKRVEQGGVIYCVLEGGIGFHNRVAAWREEHGFQDARIPFAAIQAQINLLNPEADTTRLIDAIKFAQAKMEMPVKAVVIDTLARALAGGNENAPEDMGALVMNMDRVRSETGSCVIFIHHSGKDEARGARGHSSLQAAIDTEIEVITDDFGNKTATVVKQRDLSKGQVYNFTLKVVSLGNNRHGEDVTTCVVDPATTSSGGAHAGSIKLTGHNKRALEVLNITVASGGRTGDVGVPSGYSSVPEKWWRDRFYESAMPGAERKTKEKAFSRASEALINMHLVGMSGGRVWVASPRSEINTNKHKFSDDNE